MFIKRESSLSPFREYPSTTFVGMESANLLICDVRPYISSFGKVLVSWQTRYARSSDTFQTSSFCHLSSSIQFPCQQSSLKTSQLPNLPSSFPSFTPLQGILTSKLPRLPAIVSPSSLRRLPDLLPLSRKIVKPSENGGKISNTKEQRYLDQWAIFKILACKQADQCQ